MEHYQLNKIPEEHVTDLFARRFFTGEKITLAFLTMKKDSVVPQHQHDSEVTVRGGEVVQIPSNVPHEAVAIEDTTGIDVFSPIRADWLDGSDNYLRQK